MQTRDNNQTDTLIAPTTSLTDPRNFSEVYRAHHTRLIAYATKHGATDPEATAHEALVKLLSSSPRLNINSEASLTSYLNRIVVNTITDEWRGSPEIHFRDIADLATSDATSQVTDEIVIHDAITQLSPDQRNVIQARFVNGLSLRQTAELLDKDPNAISQLQHRALKRLRTILAGLATLILIGLITLTGQNNNRTDIVEETPTTTTTTTTTAPTTTTPTTAPTTTPQNTDPNLNDADTDTPATTTPNPTPPAQQPANPTSPPTATTTPTTTPPTTLTPAPVALPTTNERPAIEIATFINGQDANTTGPTITTGDTATHDYRIINTGNTTLTNIRVTDSTTGAINCPKVTLAPGEMMRCEVKKTVTASGQVTTIGTATATSSNGTDVTDSDPANYIVNAPAVVIPKTATPTKCEVDSNEFRIQAGPDHNPQTYLDYETVTVHYIDGTTTDVNISSGFAQIEDRYQQQYEDLLEAHFDRVNFVKDGKLSEMGLSFDMTRTEDISSVSVTALGSSASDPVSCQ